MKKIILTLIIPLLMSVYAFGFELEIDSINLAKTDDKLHFGIYDNINRYSGYNVNSPGNNLRNSPYFQIGSYAEGSGLEGEATSISNFIMGEAPIGTGGIYKLVLYGSKLDTYTLKGYMHEQDSFMGYFTLMGVIDIGQIKYYEINYTPMQNPVITRIATPTDLMADITIAQKLNLIGNVKFVTEITKEINEIEAERSKGDPSHSSGDDGLTPTQKAKKEYQELLKEITEKYNKPEADEFIKQEAYTVLKEDLEYIIGHL